MERRNAAKLCTVESGRHVSRCISVRVCCVRVRRVRVVWNGVWCDHEVIQTCVQFKHLHVDTTVTRVALVYRNVLPDSRAVCEKTED